ncbi:carboxypeptidase regulatory-like domain-containing protein [Alloacidobacterium dinghuense]|uniref:Carboxypeptidase regulatory-like domain-containing protein n=1 Tax=Alloacidobacterium dinghuense TaxID=2763107 RepID=A0A7G8BQW4_9BACT|nr:carboxypeptidase regulatory-like domain-containing protein [Alloacidobacterium dinghuense]
MIKLCIRAFIFCVSGTVAAVGQRFSAPEPQTGTIMGTVTDVRNDVVPGAAAVLDGPASSDHRTVVANDNGFFVFENVKPGVPYHITVSQTGFANWISPAITLTPKQFLQLTGVKLTIAVAMTTVAVAPNNEQLATQQVEVEEKQRVLGILPSFYAVYDSHPVPLTPKLKFRLASRTATDPVTFLGTGFLAGLDQAADKFDYQQGAKGYGQRYGARYANLLTNVMIGGAVLPSVLHQDPRYYYQGTGTTESRILHVLSYPFICRGDNGHRQPNYSSLGGYLASGAIANAYYPESNRGPKLVFSTALADMGGTMVNAFLAEFVMNRPTRAAKQ